MTNTASRKSARRDLIIVAGPNGSGKTTVAEFLAHSKSIASYLNADIIARGMALKNSEQSIDVSAGKVMMKRLHEALERREDVSFESTMAGKSWVRLIELAKEHGYEVTICFVAVNSPNLAVKRVANRVREGGHHIPEEWVRRRYNRSIARFFDVYSKLCDHWYFFDNSGESAIMLAKRENGDKDEIYDSALLGAYREQQEAGN